MSQEYFQGQFEIEDGYAGGARPQYFRIGDSVLADDMTDDDLRALYGQEAEEHFRMNFGVTTKRADEFVAWARKKIGELEAP